MSATLHVGDTAPRFTADLTSGGVPVNLTGATVEVHLKKPDKTVVILAATGTAGGSVTGAAWGSVLNQAGLWSAEVQVTYSDSTVQTFGPKSLLVNPQIA